MNKIFSIEKSDNFIIYHFFGAKLTLRNYEFTKKEKSIQKKYNLDKIKEAKNIIIFLVPNKCVVNGGIQSIYSICKYSREINPKYECVISTIPGKYTYSYNPNFKNDEKVYNWEQIINNIDNAKNVIIHIPEYFANKFYKTLKAKERKVLKNKQNLRINILNQNIELMPKPKEIESLKLLTNDVSMTIAHNRYATQEVCDKWNIPTHLLSVYIDLSNYEAYNFNQKEKIIVLSPDYNENRDNVINKLKQEMSDFKLITVQNLTFAQYMDLISKAYFTITFGEGMDGYFIQPQFVNSIGFAVYNDNFFPDKTWKELKNVYNSYEDLINNITNDMRKLIENEEEYNKIISETLTRHKKLYKFDWWIDNLKRFYTKNYDFFPITNRA